METTRKIAGGQEDEHSTVNDAGQSDRRCKPAEPCLTDTCSPAFTEDTDEPISKKPCPFCGSTYVAKTKVQGGFRLRCVNCDAQTGVAQTDEILKSYWERRPQPVPVKDTDFTKVRCANCHWIGPVEQAVPAVDIIERHVIGDMFSDVECPDCGALCFPLREW